MSQETSYTYLLVAGSSQLSESVDPSYSQEPILVRSSSPDFEFTSSPPYTRGEELRLELFEEARDIEVKYLRPLRSQNHEWCRLVNMATNKGETWVPLLQRRGYVQVSIGGCNKVSCGAFGLCC